MRRLTLLLLSAFLLTSAAWGQFTTVTATTIQNGFGIPLVSGVACFYPTASNGTPALITPSGGSAVPGPFCGPISAGAFTVTTTPNLATAAPSGLLYTMVVTASSGNVVLAINGVAAVGSTFSIDALSIPTPAYIGQPSAYGLGIPYFPCLFGALYTRTDAPLPTQSGWQCVVGGGGTMWQQIGIGAPPAVPVPYVTAPQVTQLMRGQLANPFTLTTTGSAGAATYTGGVLNIPVYTGGGGGGTPGGASHSMQFNSGGTSFGGTSFPGIPFLSTTADPRATVNTDVSPLLTLPHEYASVNMPHWRAALANVKQGTGNARLCAVGDSTTAGFFASGPPSGNSNLYSYPTQLANILQSSYGIKAQSQAVFEGGEELPGGNDPRIVVGSSWSLTTALGGIPNGTSVATTSTNALSFTPSVSVDTFRILYVIETTEGTGNVNIDGGSSTPFTATGLAGVGVLKVTAGSLGTHTLNIFEASGSVHIIGFEGYDSTHSQIIIENIGAPGVKAGDLATNTKPYNAGTAAMYAAIGCDLVNLNDGLNDWGTGVSVATYTTNMQTVITAAKGGGSDIILESPNHSDPATGIASEAIQATFVEALRGLALANSENNLASVPLPFIDTWARWQTFSISSALGLYGDPSGTPSEHPGTVGYREKADQIAQGIAGSPSQNAGEWDMRTLFQWNPNTNTWVSQRGISAPSYTDTGLLSQPCIGTSSTGLFTAGTCGGTPTVIQVNGTPTSTATPVNLQTSTANTVGLTVTPSNPSVGNVKYEVTGSSYTGNAATATNVAVGGLTGLGTGIATFLATPSSANLAAALTDETGSGAAVFATSPTLVTPLLGTPTSGVITNLTGTCTTCSVGGNAATATAVAVGGITGLGTGVATFLTTPSSANLLSALTTKTGTGNAVFSISPTLTGTPDASGATQFKLPVAAGFATLANGEQGYDTTALNWHAWANGVDNLNAIVPVSVTITNNDCAQWSNVAGVITLKGTTCGGGGSSWSGITNPTANLSLAMAANTTTFTYGAATGSAVNMYNITDTASNTGTGYLFRVGTAASSNAIPAQFFQRGTALFTIGATAGGTGSILAGTLVVNKTSNVNSAGLEVAGGIYVTNGGITSQGSTSGGVAAELVLYNNNQTSGTGSAVQFSGQNTGFGVAQIANIAGTMTAAAGTTFLTGKLVFSTANGAAPVAVADMSPLGDFDLLLGHITFAQTTAPVASSCGGGTVATGGTDNIFSVTGITAATACTVTFNRAIKQGSCTVSTSSTSINSSVGSISTSAVTFGMALFTGTIYATCY